MMQQVVLATPDMVTGMISIFGVDACVFVNPRVRHSFVSHSLVVLIDRDPILSDLIIEASIPMGKSLWLTQVRKRRVILW